MKTLAERLTWARAQKSLRDKMEFTQMDLASRAGVSQGAIGHLESGRTNTSRSITSIAKALEVDPAWLADGRGEPFPSQWGAVPPSADAMEVVIAEDHDPDFYQIPKVQLQLSAGLTGFQTVPELGRQWIFHVFGDQLTLLGQSNPVVVLSNENCNASYCSKGDCIRRPN